MTRQDYKAIAQALANCAQFERLGDKLTAKLVVEQMTYALRHHCQAKGYNFDSVRFIAACGLEEMKP